MGNEKTCTTRVVPFSVGPNPKLPPRLKEAALVSTLYYTKQTNAKWAVNKSSMTSLLNINENQKAQKYPFLYRA